ncbi:MAG: FtsW/RodA/SpoVE family cell cycle protein [Bacteroidales bacterium]
MDLTKALFKGDRVIWTVFFFLCVISVVEVYSASSMLSYKAAVRHFDPIVRHATFLIAGTALIIMIQNMSMKRIQTLGFIALVLGILFLIYAMVGGMKVNDASRWVSFFGIRFQPSEFAKLGVIITTSYILSKYQDEDNASPKAFKLIMLIAGVVCLFILKENISTAVLLFAVVYLLMFIGRVEFKKLGIVAGIGIGLIVIGAFTITHLPKNVLKETRFETAASRLSSFISGKKTDSDDKIDLNGKDCQKYYGKIAIANGKVFGKMPGNSETRDFLPQAFSDFIFAIILEETGLAGGLFVIFLYFVLLFRVGVIAKRCTKVFPALVIIGCSLIIAFQALINMSVAVNLIPVTGQPLPLISRGGTSTLISCIYFGIILSVSQFAAKTNAKPQEISQKEDISIEEAKAEIEEAKEGIL